MRLVSVLLLVLLSGGVMAAPDNLNGKKFEQLEQMIKDLEGQITALTIENALLNDAVSDLERDLGDAEFEIIQLENTVAILSAGGGGGQEVEYEFVGFVDTNNCPQNRNNCTLDWIVESCEQTYGEGARITYIDEWAEEKFDIGGTQTYFVERGWKPNGGGAALFIGTQYGTNTYSAYNIWVGYNGRLSCSAPI